MKNVTLGCYSHIGKVRVNQEDNFFFQNELSDGSNQLNIAQIGVDKTPICVAVFDGMGGMQHGEAASQEAAVYLKHRLSEKDLRFKEDAVINQLFQDMNNSVLYTERQLGANIGTTAIVLIFDKNEAVYANIGDSRGYLMRCGKLTQMSEDHTDYKLIQALNIEGRKPELFQYIGIDTDEIILQPAVNKVKVETQDQYLICSDGLTDMLDDEYICRILGADMTFKQKVTSLGDTALDMGGKDNISFILLEISEGNYE